MAYKLSDIVDIPAIQGLMDQLWKASGIPTAFLDIDGSILVAAGWQDICVHFHRRHPEALRRCHESDAYLTQHLEKGHPLPECGYFEYRCRNGLFDVALPIIIEGEHLANLFLGQFFYETPDEGFFRRQAEGFGFDERAYLEALRRVPIFPREKVGDILRFSAGLVNMITRMGVEKLRRLKAEKYLSHREAFESLIAGISSRFIALPAAETDRGIDAALREIGEFSAADRSYLFRFSADMAEMSNSHEWCSPGTESQIGRLQGLATNSIPWFLDRIHRQEVLHVPRVGDLPPEAATEREHWEEQDIRSLVVVPMISEGALTGFLGLDMVRCEKQWKEEDFALLHTAAGILGNAIERQEAARRLAESEERLSLALQSSHEGVWDWNLKSNEVYFSPRYFTMLGYQPGEFPAEFDTWVALLHPDDRGLAISGAEETARTGRNFEMEFRMINKSGKPVHILSRGGGVEFDAEGKPIRVIGIHMDITERRRATEELERSRALLAEAQRIARLGSWDTNLVTGEIAWSEEMFRLVGKDPLSFVPTTENLLELIHPDDRQAMQVALQRATSGEPKYRLDHRVILDDGTVRYFEVQGEVSYDAEGRAARVIGTTLDVTRERELDRIKNEFISTAAHELRTPLTSVLGYAELLLHPEEYGIFDPALQKEFLTIIKEKGQRLERIVSEMLDLSRVQSGQIISLDKSSFDVCGELVRFISECQKREPCHRFGISLPEVPIRLTADWRKMEQVMENLVGNAAKFSPPGSAIRVGGRQEGCHFLIFVEDEGIGMTQEQVSRVFDKFYRANSSDSAKEGLGLGMTISRYIVEAHGGRIWLESETGRGTTVSFTIPLGEGKTGEENPYR